MEYAQPTAPRKRRARHSRQATLPKAKSVDILWGDSQKVPRTLPPEAEQLCDKFLDESFAFATKFAELAGVADDRASKLRGTILTRCSEAIAAARLSALESTKP